MGASKEKKKRIEDRQAGVESKWEIREKEAAKKKKTSAKNYAVVGIIAVVSVLILFFSSNMFYRMFDAVKVGGEGYSAPEYKFYYYDTYSSIYNQYYQNYGEYAQYFMPDEEQLQESTLENLRQSTMLMKEAKAEGFAVPADTEEYVQNNIDAAKSYAKQNGFPNLNGYLAANYGQGMNEKLFRQLLSDSYYVGNYYNAKYNEKEYTEAEIEAYYQENSVDFDKFTFYSKFFSGAAVADDEETEEDETVSKEDAMAKAKTDAEAYFENAYDTFKTDGTTPTTTDGMNVSTNYKEWLGEDARVEGDKKLVETEDGYYVVCFVSRDKNEYKLVNVRHILFAPETIAEDAFEKTEDYTAAVEAAKQAAEKKANDVYAEWQSGDATEDSFIAITEKYKDDAEDSGLVDGIYKGRTVAGFDDWSFDNRETGDTAVVETTYGYHVVYFSGYGEEYHQYIGENYKRSDDFSAWMEEKLADGYELKTTGMFKFAD